MVTTVAPAEQRVLLHNISWQTFKTMLVEMGSQRGSRLAYDEGTLEIMTSLMPHENSNRLIEVFVGVPALNITPQQAGVTIFSKSGQRESNSHN